jgi:cytochrome c-type biogenesis protein CcsB
MLRLEELLIQAALVLYGLAVLGYLVRLASRWQPAGTAATVSAWAGLSAQTGMLVARGISARHVPLVSMYEYLSAFAWMVALAYLVFERRAARGTEGVQAAGAPALLLALALLAYASSLPSHLKQAESLMPILKSNWLVFHVSVAVVGYGAAGLASALACLYFISQRAGPKAAWVRDRLPAAPVLDQAVYGAVRFAFPFLTLVNVTGAIWAYNAWGRYWGWDAKETWSLITWLVYVFYLHARLRAGWRPQHTNAVVVAGIITILFTFLGVNQLAAFSDSLHSYASGG